MFPLGTVLFPSRARCRCTSSSPATGPWYSDCLDGDGEFGVVLIERGFEVGGGDTRFGTGTVARIVEAAELPDGRWLLDDGRHAGASAWPTWLPDDPYPVAEVEDLPIWSAHEAGADVLTRAEQAVRRALAC